MSGDRLSLAIGAGDLPAEGRILVLGPPGQADLSALPAGRITVEQTFRPDHDAWARRGLEVTARAEGPFAAAIVFAQRSRDASRAAVARAASLVATGGPIWVDGAKTDGIDSLLKDLRGRVGLSSPLAKAHGKIARFANEGDQVFADWAARDLTPAPGFKTLPGVFSAEAVDRGSLCLAAALPADLKGKVADLGAGWGWLSAQILARPGVSLLHLVEADRVALDCARLNVTDPRARFHWEDATTFTPGDRLDWVVMNPPFHVSRAADPRLGIAFIRAAAAMLAPHGRLLMVANRHLPYEKTLAAAFRHVEEVSMGDGFKVLKASAPVRSRR